MIAWTDMKLPYIKAKIVLENVDNMNRNYRGET